ncbi:MAG TPA: RecQ family ATP-dependent DNA helicase, partial [Actinomycetota bacterium]|nr:RecQ family ATP-dependent DNA helicase [Actinomycetota bacterium]
QWEAIDRLVGRRGRVLVVQRTGWGKSAVYVVATRLLRDAGAGPTVLISPLLALIRNQIQMAERAGVRAATINSANRDDWDSVEARVRAGEVDLLLVSPERLNNPRFRQAVLAELASTVGLLVVDEAHCISDWGHDFRPDYRRIARVVQLLPPSVPVLCTTATANDRVVGDIVGQLGQGLEVIRGPLDRESLELAVLDLPDQAQRLAWLAERIPRLPGSGIVYCLTVADTERVSGWLRTQGIEAVAYSGEQEHEARLVFEQALLGNQVKVVVATSALGMGFDKPDLRFVIHYQAPGSPIAYYQQVGRAGRAVDRAVGVLLRGHEDREIQDYFIESAFPLEHDAERVVRLLEDQAEPVPIGAIERAVNARHSRILAMLKVLEVEGAVEHVEGGWRRTLAPWSYDTDRVEQVTALRRAEQAAMAAYAATAGCRMAFLRQALDDPDAGPCGRCDNCTGRGLDTPVDQRRVASALIHLRGTALELVSRRQWPPGLGIKPARIPADRQLQPGRVLGVYGDGGWGGLVKQAKYLAGRFPDELVDATVALLGRWSPAPPPTWVCCVPSTSSPELVPEFAGRVAAVLGLPFRPVVRRVRQGRPQKEMQNSVQQFRNVDGAFEVAAPLPAGPVLLIDDIVDSGWTLTVVGVALGTAGAGPVYPFALAKAVSG